MLPPQPIHIATRGLLGGAYGIATRGYLVLPDVVPRFPSDAVVQYDELLGFITEEDLHAYLQQMDLAAVLKAPLDIEGIIRDLAWMAMMKEQDELGGEVADKPLTAEVEPEGDHVGEVTDGDPVAEVEDGDAAAEVKECEEPATLKEKPGEGRCRD